jgi:GDPmannose 4,6-dehydratase
MDKKRALITGITGQDGFYLSKLLLEKGYEIFGMYRKSVLDVHERVPHLDPEIQLIEGDLRDTAPLISIIQKCQPDEIYNLGAQSFLQTAWEEPELACDVNGMGVLRLLEAIRMTNPKIKLYQASSREIFGIPKEGHSVSEKTPINPTNIYASGKAFAQSIIENYKKKYGIFVCSGMAFNHESPKRGREFVTRKITQSAARIRFGLQECLSIGNLNSKRDWSYSGDIVEAMWLMMQKEKPDNYVLGAGEAHSVKEFIEEAFKVVGMSLVWEGEGLNEIGKCNGRIVVKIDERFYRSGDEELVFGDTSKARNELGWIPKTGFKELVKTMVEADLKRVKAEIILDY